MHNLRTLGSLLGAGAVILSLAAGCGGNGGSDTANAAANAGDQAVNTAANAGDAVANTAASAGDAVANTATAAGDAVSNAATNVGKAFDSATLTPQIKTALGGNKALNGSNINVDTNPGAKTVTLSGTVKSAQQKTLASAIATSRSKGSGFKIVNNLKTAK